MKTFFGSFFGTLFAIFFLGACAFLGLVAIVVLIGATEKGPKVPDNSLLVLDLAAPITDAPPQFEPGQLLSGLSEDQRDLSDGESFADKQLCFELSGFEGGARSPVSF